MSGRVYDINENKTMVDFLTLQNQQLQDLEKENNPMQKTVFRYAIILGGSVILILGLKYFLSKKK